MPGITFSKCYVSDGKTYATLDEAKSAGLVAIFATTSMAGSHHQVMADVILKHADAIMDILSTTDSSRPLARRSNGGKKKRTPKAPEAPPVDKEAPPF